MALWCVVSRVVGLGPPRDDAAHSEPPSRLLGTPLTAIDKTCASASTHEYRISQMKYQLGYARVRHSSFVQYWIEMDPNVGLVEMRSSARPGSS